MARYDPVSRTSVPIDRDISATSKVAEAPPLQQQQRASDRFTLSGSQLEEQMPTPPHKRAKKSYISRASVGLAVVKMKTG
jgi:hypothetical protein